MNMLLLVAGRVSDTSVLTGVNLALIAAAMIVVVFGMLWGFRQKRRRAESERETRERQEEIAAAPPVERVAPTPAPRVEERSAVEPPIMAAPPPQPTPEPIATPPVAPAPPPLAEAPIGDAGGVPLTRLKGLGPKAAALLAERGVTDIAALAALSGAEAATIDAELGAFAGRMVKDRWHEQAQLLNAGDIAGYEATFGKLGS